MLGGKLLKDGISVPVQGLAILMRVGLGRDLFKLIESKGPC